MATYTFSTDAFKAPTVLLEDSDDIIAALGIPSLARAAQAVLTCSSVLEPDTPSPQPQPAASLFLNPAVDLLGSSGQKEGMDTMPVMSSTNLMAHRTPYHDSGAIRKR